MITERLIQLLIKDSGNVGNAKVRQRYGEVGGAVGIVCNILLFFGKLTVGILSGSIAIMADAVNNLSDAGSSVVAMIGFRLSAKPADDEHPFGHGRLEYVAGLVIAVIIIAVGIDFFKGAVQRIFHPTEIQVSGWGLTVVAMAVPVKYWMYRFYRKLGRKIDSPVLQATAFDSLSDIMTTGVVILSVVLDPLLPGVPADGIAGVVVAVLIMLGGVKVVRDTINPLLGECPDHALVEELERKILDNPDICGVHDLIMHNYGPGHYFATAHAEVHSDCDPVKIHDSLEATEQAVAMAMPVRLTLHCDPFDRDDPEFKAWRLAANKAAAEIDPEFRVYDFRMSHNRHYLHLRFNVLVPRRCVLDNRELRDRIQDILRRRDPHVLVSVSIENAYV